VCACGASTYWSPTSATDSEPTGYQNVNGARTAVNVATIAVTVQQNGSSLQFQVCKVGGTFSSNVTFYIHDATSASLASYGGTLGTAGLGCSAWTPLQNSSGYAASASFNGVWELVSPSGAGAWNSQCAMTASSTGTCWYGSNLSMQRTCL
jgi:hypothetical protein